MCALTSNTVHELFCNSSVILLTKVVKNPIFVDSNSLLLCFSSIKSVCL